MATALITTIPFADKDRRPIALLESAGIDYRINPLGRKLKEDELAGMIADVDVLIAGTEPITDRVMERANRLKLISRIGIGLDSVDLLAAERRGIRVSYTPDAPSPAVAELTIGLMLSLLRHAHLANARMHEGQWQRMFGRRIAESTIGLIGVGRIGSRVLRHLSGFTPRRVLLNDLAPKPEIPVASNVEWVSQETILREADVISIHVPLTPQTRNMIARDQLQQMKPDALLINTARGGIVNESDLFDVLSAGGLGGAAMDVFEQEPYAGPLVSQERCLLTSHMGSMSIDCRTKMEIEATEEAVRFLQGEPLLNQVPAGEYQLQRASARSARQ